MKLLAVPFFILCFDSLALAADNPGRPFSVTWNPPSKAEALHFVRFVDSRTGWVVGENGTILATRDGGDSWQSQTSGVNENLRAVDFIDERTGWIVGQNGTILVTHDGGNQWRPQVSQTDKTLAGVRFSDANLGWAVGEIGTILATHDGGNHWQPQISGTEKTLSSVHFVDGYNGWIVGQEGLVLATQDGGKNWLPQASATHRTLSGVYFTDVGSGWAVGTNGTILATRDGGGHWQPQPKGTHKSLRSVYFADMRNGWAVGADGTIQASLGGAYWLPQTSGTGKNLWGVHFSDAHTGWAVGDDRTILVTHDSGQRWRPQNMSTAQNLLNVQFADRMTGWAVGVSGTILATRDGGDHWTPQTSGTDSTLWSLHFVDAHTGWVAGHTGTILATRNGGDSWRGQSTGTTKNLTSVYFVDTHIGWAVGQDGTILATRDGGESWQPQISGTEYDLTDVRFVDSRTGWAVGLGGTILGTRDGGDHWQSQIMGTDDNLDLTYIHFTDSRTGWAVGLGGTILATRDGGDHWQSQTSGSDKDLMYVFFANATTGWVVGLAGTILTTRDGGEHWQLQHSGTDRNLWAICLTDSLTGWIVGDNGTLIRGGPPKFAPWVDTQQVSVKDDLAGQVELSFVVHEDANRRTLHSYVEYKTGAKQWEPLGPVATGPGADSRWHARWNPAAFGLATNQSVSYRVRLVDGGPPLAPFEVGTFLYRPWWTAVSEQFDTLIKEHLWWSLLALGYALWALICLLLYWFLPVFAMRLNETLAPFDVRLPEWIGGSKIALRHALIIGFLGHRPRTLDAWVSTQVAIARNRYAIKSMVKNRDVHISLPVEVDGNFLSELSGKALRTIFSSRSACLLICGEGGSGKTSLACQIGRWAIAQDDDKRPIKQIMLPVLIEQTVDLSETEERDPFLEEIRRRLEDLTDSPDPVPDLRLVALLKHKRVLVIIDGLSEMSKTAQARFKPRSSVFSMSALIVTSRIEDVLGQTQKNVIVPLRVDGNHLSQFMDAYLRRRGRRNLFNDTEFFKACLQLSLIVGQRQITVLLAKLYAEKIIATKDGTSDDTVPSNIPDLMLTYINHLNRQISNDRIDVDTVHRDAKMIAWKCLEHNFIPSEASRDEILKALGGTDALARLAYFLEGLHLIRAVEPAGIRFLLDPLAEYLAGLYVVAHYGKGRRAWQNFLSRVRGIPGGPLSIVGFLLAVRDCCLAKGDAVGTPKFVGQELALLAGLSSEVDATVDESRR